MLDAARASHGRDVFATVCAVCHSPTGMGRYGLGKDLVHSDFVADSSDAALLAFVIKGRDLNDPANTMKVAMPPRGGNMTLTDEDLGGAIEYLRGLQDPRRLPVLAAPVALSAAPPTEAEKAEALAAAGGDAELAQYIASGKKLFASTCVACHGSDAKGLPNLGKDLTVSPFVAESDDDTLLAMLKRGRAPGEPGNTTGIAMPPKGGNPALSEDDLLDIIEFLRSIHTAKKTGS